jgi:hypothetical protein
MVSHKATRATASPSPSIRSVFSDDNRSTPIPDGSQGSRRIIAVSDDENDTVSPVVRHVDLPCPMLTTLPSPIPTRKTRPSISYDAASPRRHPGLAPVKGRRRWFSAEYDTLSMRIGIEGYHMRLSMIPPTARLRERGWTAEHARNVKR